MEKIEKRWDNYIASLHSHYFAATAVDTVVGFFPKVLSLGLRVGHAPRCQTFKVSLEPVTREKMVGNRGLTV